MNSIINYTTSGKLEFGEHFSADRFDNKLKCNYTTTKCNIFSSWSDTRLAIRITGLNLIRLVRNWNCE